MKETYTLTVERKEENGVHSAVVTLSDVENDVTVGDIVSGEDLKKGTIARCVGEVYYALQMARVAKEHNLSQILAAGMPDPGTPEKGAFDAFLDDLAKIRG